MTFKHGIKEWLKCPNCNHRNSHIFKMAKHLMKNHYILGKYSTNNIYRCPFTNAEFNTINNI